MDPDHPNGRLLFCGISGGGPGWTPQKSDKLSLTLPCFLQGAKSAKLWPKFRYHLSLERLHFDLKDFFGILKNLVGDRWWAYTWYQSGGVNTPTLSNVSAKGISKCTPKGKMVKSPLLSHRLSNFAKILQNDTYEGSQRMERSKGGTGSRFPPPGGIFLNFVLEAYSHCRSSYLHQIWCVHRKCGPATRGMVQIRSSKKSKMADGGHLELLKSL